MRHNKNRVGPSDLPRLRELLSVACFANNVELVHIWNQNDVGEKLCAGCPSSFHVVREIFTQIISEYDSKNK